ncbi:hypothetical protein MMC09_005363 [Bachmanniomyces sp. S44760]|nr:hypothetical protein [Bachmanniomyces sp. S44760]
MPPRFPLTLPNNEALAPSRRLASNNPSVLKLLLKISRPSLLSLVQIWLSSEFQLTCSPYLGSELEGGSTLRIYQPASDIHQLRSIYVDFAERKGSKREVVERILERDWRYGLSLQQIAMVDVQYLCDHERSQKWTALRLQHLRPTARKIGQKGTETLQQQTTEPMARIPRFHGPTFVQKLQQIVNPLVKAHYHLSRPITIEGITLLRIYMIDSPYNSQAALALQSKNISSVNATLDVSKALYFAFSDNSPFIYVSHSSLSPTLDKQGPNNNSSILRKVVLDAIPMAFSRPPRERYTLKTTSLSTRSLFALTALRGPGRSNAAQGGWSIFANGNIEESPLIPHTSHELPTEINKENLPHPQQAQTDKPGSKKRGRPRKSSLSASNPPVPLLSEHRNPPTSFSYDPSHHPSSTKRLKNLSPATARFGNSALPTDKKGIERLDIRIQDPHPILIPSPNSHNENNNNNASWTPEIALKFQGEHVFAGFRKLVEMGVVDGRKMPGWMTGEDGKSVGVVRGGRMRG